VIAGAREIIIAYFAVGLTLCAWGLGGLAIGIFWRMRGARRRDRVVEIDGVSAFEHERLRGRVLSALVAAAGVILCSRGLALHAASAKSLVVKTEQTWFIAILACACIAIGAACVFTRRANASRTPRCPRCRFDLSHMTVHGGEPRGKQCTECGRHVRSLRELFKSRWDRRVTWLILLTPLIAYMAFCADRVQKHGRMGFFPTTLMIAGFDMLPDALIMHDWTLNAPKHYSLINRKDAGDLWGWQREWLERTAAKHIQSPVSVQGMIRSLSFRGFVLEDFGSLQAHVVLDAMISSDAKARQAGWALLEFYSGTSRVTIRANTAEPVNGGVLYRDRIEDVSPSLEYSRRADDFRLSALCEGRSDDLLNAWKRRPDDFAGCALLWMAGTDFDAAWNEVKEFIRDLLTNWPKPGQPDTFLLGVHTWSGLAKYSEPARSDLLATIDNAESKLSERLYVAVKLDGPTVLSTLFRERELAMQWMRDPSKSVAERLDAARKLSAMGPSFRSVHAVNKLLAEEASWDPSLRDELRGIVIRLTPTAAK
jgi:hypothetical protein